MGEKMTPEQAKVGVKVRCTDKCQEKFRFDGEREVLKVQKRYLKVEDAACIQVNHTNPLSRGHFTFYKLYELEVVE
jgi:D-hexose-6-phosphate mutarotase